MSLIVFPAIVAFVLLAAIPAAVGAVIRRRDRHNPSAAVADRAAGALFVVKNRAWQAILLRVVGIVLLVSGGLFTLISVADADDLEGPGPLIAAACMTVAGVVFVVLAIGVGRFRVDAFDDRLVVHPLFGSVRLVGPTDIGEIRPTTNRFGGVDVRGLDRRILFTATTISVGYRDLVPYLEERTPTQWTTFTTTYGR